jgi:hypothetical protein
VENELPSPRAVAGIFLRLRRQRIWLSGFPNPVDSPTDGKWENPRKQQNGNKRPEIEKEDTIPEIVDPCAIRCERRDKNNPND